MIEVVFGVKRDGYPQFAHIYGNQRLSLCGRMLRDMANEREKRLPTCTECTRVLRQIGPTESDDPAGV